ncbi:alpha/beta hydrolase [Actinophytocola sp.]|uniref:alpha/beta hydrolase n=1 Tax=Actinophytocola sp. TaxID=1872138 RepID=UPI003D6C5A82
MTRVVISHEYAGSPDQAEAPRPEHWLEAVTAEVTDPRDTVLVGHSLGAVNLLRLLQPARCRP